MSIEALALAIGNFDLWRTTGREVAAGDVMMMRNRNVCQAVANVINEARRLVEAAKEDANG